MRAFTLILWSLLVALSLQMEWEELANLRDEDDALRYLNTGELNSSPTKMQAVSASAHQPIQHGPLRADSTWTTHQPVTQHISSVAGPSQDLSPIQQSLDRTEALDTSYPDRLGEVQPAQTVKDGVATRRIPIHEPEIAQAPRPLLIEERAHLLLKAVGTLERQLGFQDLWFYPFQGHSLTVQMLSESYGSRFKRFYSLGLDSDLYFVRQTDKPDSDVAVSLVGSPPFARKKRLYVWKRSAGSAGGSIFQFVGMIGSTYNSKSITNRLPSYTRSNFNSVSDADVQTFTRSDVDTVRIIGEDAVYDPTSLLEMPEKQVLAKPFKNKIQQVKDHASNVRGTKRKGSSSGDPFPSDARDVRSRHMK